MTETQTKTETRTLEVPGGTVQYDVRGDLQADGPHRVLVLAGYPMDATGFGTLASYFTDRPVVTYDPRPVGRSTGAYDDRPLTPQDHAEDLHRVIAALGVGPVDLFGSSGGAVNALRPGGPPPRAGGQRGRTRTAARLRAARPGAAVRRLH